jgi:hypothetical protein
MIRAIGFMLANLVALCIYLSNTMDFDPWNLPEPRKANAAWIVLMLTLGLSILMMLWR